MIAQTAAKLSTSFYNIIVTLENWKIGKNDSFYAFARRKGQPSWNFPEPSNDDLLDQTHGMYGQLTLWSISIEL